MTKQVFLEDQTTRPNQTQVVKLYDLQFQKFNSLNQDSHKTFSLHRRSYHLIKTYWNDWNNQQL